MNTFTTICGSICLILICLALLAFAVSLAADLCRRAFEQFEWAVAVRTRQQVGRSLDASGWWFGESPDAALVVRIIGQRLARDETIDANSVREQWREAKKESAN